MPRMRQTTEKAKDFKGTVRRLLAEAARYRLALGVVLVFAVLSTIFNIVGPKILAKATTALATGWVAKLTGTGSIDFAYIGRFGHLTYAKDPERTLIHSFHMPMFMMLSGYLFKPRPVGSIITRGTKHFLLAAYATLMIDIAISFYTLADENEPLPTGGDWLETFLLYDGLWRNLPVWYLFAMVICQAVSAVLLKGGPLMLTLAAAGATVFNLSLSTRIVWWPISTLFAFPFFALGVLFGRKDLAEPVQRRRDMK